ncbi:glycosyltransferase, partial [bacterium]|nr:glycosyltransferase [bacterium]
ESDVIQLHLPQFDAAGVALRGRIARKPTVITYHCDLLMPPGVISKTANAAINVMNNLAGLATHRIVTYTRDYADHSAYLAKFPRKTSIIPPPVVLPEVPQAEKDAFARLHNPENRHPVIGMVARFATEKGVEVLLNAMPQILEVYPKALVEFVGPYGNIIGEEKYYARLKPQIDRYIARGNWQFLGSLNPREIAAYYPHLDVHVLPSLNSTEAFGLVQIEAMMNGVPCVTSDLPGVRQPVAVHGMGKIFPIGDSKQLAYAVLDVLAHREKYTHADPGSFAQYTPDSTAAAYLDLFSQIQQELK